MAAARAMIRVLTPVSANAWKQTPSLAHKFSTTANVCERQQYKLVIVGAGSGGCATAAKFVPKLGKDQVAVIDPAEMHYYQPMWTLVGGGVKDLGQTGRPMESVLPKGCKWIKEGAVSFHPDQNFVTTQSGLEVGYEYLVVAMGMQLNYNKITGAEEALAKDPRVCSNYSARYVTKTFPALQQFSQGRALFTFPNTPIKCAGAPQKIVYLADDYFRKTGKRDKAEIVFNTSLGVIFGVKKYANSLLEVVASRDVKVNYRRNLIEIKPDSSEAVFADLDSSTGQTETFKYDFLHVTPPMSAPRPLVESPLVDGAGFLDVDRASLQHRTHPNIFGIGDCTSLPTSKTAAAVASQSGVLRKNLTAVMAGQKPTAVYDGYTSCPLITKVGKCILAEFDYDAQPLETFPFDQGKERTSMYYAKAYMMPELYWRLMLTGVWEGPATYRKIMHLGDRRPAPAQG